MLEHCCNPPVKIGLESSCAPIVFTAPHRSTSYCWWRAELGAYSTEERPGTKAVGPWPWSRPEAWPGQVRCAESNGCCLRLIALVMVVG